MPIPNTIYNTTTQLEEDLSYNYIISCNANDSNQKLYLTTKAAYIMHPYSKCRNLVTKFNNEKEIYKYKPAFKCFTCLNQTSSHNEEQTQKIIQNQVRTSGSVYTMNLKSLYINSDDLSVTKPWNNASDRRVAHGISGPTTNTSIRQNYGVDIKHNSYDRYLGRKKSQYLKTEPISTPVNVPKMGNKTRKFGLINCTKIC